MSNFEEDVQHVAINEAGQLVMSDSFWFHCKAFVKAIANKDHLNNEQKHAAVVEELTGIVGDIGETMFKIGIGAAVLWLKSQQPQTA